MSQTLRKLWMGEFPKDLGKLDDYFAKSKAVDDAYEAFRKNKFQKIISMEYEAELMGQKWIDITSHEKSLKDKLKEKKAIEHNNLYCFITISPKADYEFSKFKDKVQKFVERNMFQQYRYVFEQRGTKPEEAGKGFHAHILVKRNLDYKPSKISVNSKNTFKDVCNVNNPNILNIQHIGAEFARDKDEYMTGVKTGEGKDEKQEIDKLWRETNHLESVYGPEFFKK